MMELRSTTAYKDIDFEEMLGNTTFEDLMRGMYLGSV